MIPRDIRLLPEHLFPTDEWRVVEAGYSRTWMGNAETIFSISNGFLGIRGTFEEGRPTIEAGTFCNGFHETWPIVHAEDAYGFARTGQTIVNVPDVTLMKLYVDDEPLFLPTARLTEYERALNLHEGVLRRELNWSTPAGKQVRVRSSRLISFEHRHLGAITYEVEVDEDAPVVISSQVLNRQDATAIDEPTAGRDPRRARGFTGRVLHAGEHLDEGHRIITGYRTGRSKMTLGVGIDHLIETENHWTAQRSWSPDQGKVVFSIDARPGVPIRITKFFTYHTSRSVPEAELVDRSGRVLDRGMRDGYEALELAQRRFLDEFWEVADIEVDGPPRVQQAIRWNIYQLLQASARAETSGIPAKGLTGQAYEGHYFWDTEVYVTPFLSYTNPRVTRNLIRFRHHMLPFARERAKEMSEGAGALFPWRTINGEEASSYYAAGTAQYHIDADVAFAIKRYVDVRGDRSLLTEVGGEILVETARLWVGLGFYGPSTGRFHIHGVTGPDEYTTVVNDNAFTNLMARANLRYAAEVAIWMREEEPVAYHRLVHETGLVDEEIEAWQAAAEAMYIPYDTERGIHPQDANFLEKEVWDFANTPRDHYPLLLHYHPLVIYRNQVIKQADVVLAMVLLGDEFSEDQKRRNFDYYDPLTTGDSSLSACVQSIIAAEVGYEQKALEYFHYAVLMDLADISGNVIDGVHIASTGGVWMALIYGFGGLRDYDGKLSFDPRLPSPWRRLAFRLRFHDRRLAVEVTHEQLRFEVTEGESLTIRVRGRELVLEPSTPVTLPSEEFEQPDLEHVAEA